MKQTPKMMYGTAWKEDRTAELTLKALNQGFHAIDTANQRKHYHEAGVGAGLERFYSTSGVGREELFLQTKFTFAQGQDHRKPFNENDSFAKQVQDSFTSSLQHLNTTYLDSYILHGPFSSRGIVDADLEVWQAMEGLHRNQQVLSLGVSNVSSTQLHDLWHHSEIPPTFVQNRCFARTGWDYEVRALCREKGIIYQGFSLLTANARELSSPTVYQLTEDYGKTTAQIVFKFCQQLGMICLTGTTNEKHMKEDLDIDDFELSRGAIEALERIAF